MAWTVIDDEEDASIASIEPTAIACVADRDADDVATYRREQRDASADIYEPCVISGRGGDAVAR